MATITVRGHASLPVEPDLVAMTLILAAQSDAPDAAFAELTERGRVLTELLEELDVPRERRVTEGVYLHADMEYDARGGERLRGYRAFGRTLVDLDDPARATRVMTEGVRRAGAQIEGPPWRVRPDNPARLEACTRAADAARERAAVYARGLGRELGALVGAVEPGTAAPAARSAGSAARAGTTVDYPVEAGRVEVTAALDVTYELREAP